MFSPSEVFHPSNNCPPIHPSIQPTMSKSYIVEEILSERIRNNTIEYHIKWEDYPHSQNTWEPKKNLIGCAVYDQYLRLKASKAEAQSSASSSSSSKASTSSSSSGVKRTATSPVKSVTSKKQATSSSSHAGGSPSSGRHSSPNRSSTSIQSVNFENTLNLEEGIVITRVTINGESQQFTNKLSQTKFGNLLR